MVGLVPVGEIHVILEVLRFCFRLGPCYVKKNVPTRRAHRPAETPSEASQLFDSKEAESTTYKSKLTFSLFIAGPALSFSPLKHINPRKSLLPCVLHYWSRAVGDNFTQAKGLQKNQTHD